MNQRKKERKERKILWESLLRICRLKLRFTHKNKLWIKRGIKFKLTHAYFKTVAFLRLRRHLNIFIKDISSIFIHLSKFIYTLMIIVLWINIKWASPHDKNYMHSEVLFMKDNARPHHIWCNKNFKVMRIISFIISIHFFNRC